MLEDLALIAEPNPTMIKDLFEITDRDRAPWDAETLLMMAIARHNMQHRATDKDCEQPFIEFASDEDMQDTNATVVSSFFSRFKEH